VAPLDAPSTPHGERPSAPARWGDGGNASRHEGTAIPSLFGAGHDRRLLLSNMSRKVFRAENNHVTMVTRIHASRTEAATSALDGY